MSLVLKKTTAGIILTFLFVLNVFAPDYKTLTIREQAPVQPFSKLIYAVGMVETGLNTLSYNPVEQAAGCFQIRPIRVEDYNRRTGKKYTLRDMFNYEKSEEIFLYYASLYGPANFEKIAKRWNGSGPGTIEYWKMVKEYL